MQALVARNAPGILGFFLVVNLFLIPGAAQSPRFTDFLSVPIALWLLVRAHRRGLPALPLAAIMVLALSPLLWAGASFLAGQRSTMVQGMRWMLAIPWGLALTLATTDEDDRVHFVYGLLFGCALNAAVVLMQSTPLDVFLRPLGISSTDSEGAAWAGRGLRLPGLHRHYGASSAVASLIAPAALYLYLIGRRGIWLPVAALALLGVTLQLTYTRSPLAVTAVSVAIGLIAARDTSRILRLGASLIALTVVAVAIVGLPGGTARWSDSASIEANANERGGSTLEGLQIALENPGGLGVENAKEQMTLRTAVPSTHNAFVQTAVVFGTPMALILLLVFAYHSWGLVRGVDDPGWFIALFALHVFGLFLFEEHLVNPTFAIVATWLVGASAQRFLRTGQARKISSRWPAT